MTSYSDINKHKRRSLFARRMLTLTDSSEPNFTVVTFFESWSRLLTSVTPINEKAFLISSIVGLKITK